MPLPRRMRAWLAVQERVTAPRAPSTLPRAISSSRAGESPQEPGSGSSAGDGVDVMVCGPVAGCGSLACTRPRAIIWSLVLPPPAIGVPGACAFRESNGGSRDREPHGSRPLLRHRMSRTDCRRAGTGDAQGAWSADAQKLLPPGIAWGTPILNGIAPGSSGAALGTRDRSTRATEMKKPRKSMTCGASRLVGGTGIEPVTPAV